MADINDPIDDERTTRPRAGMVMKDKRQAPGLALAVVAVLALAGCLTAAALNEFGWAIGLGLVVLAASIGGVGWVLAGRSATARRRDQGG